ncbi:MAG: fold metallo-hydrolase [Flaviaesturariibacter sp.]|nr:fold metallo-hydrolase [Flaviaesturariibacter sp.]
MNKAMVDRREQTATAERELASNVYLVAPGVYRMKDMLVNVFILQNRDATEWVLVDAGLRTSAPKIREMARSIFGSTGSTPRAIIMTHGHFDHRGSLQELAGEWGVPVYCHRLERPYLMGKAAYPPADPAVGGGLLSLLSFTFPNAPIDVSDHLQELPENGMVPELSDWRWIHTPGHTPGHISLFRDGDGVLIAGDAFTTTMQESALSVATQKKILCGPPKYFTPDWVSAAHSVKELAALEPNVIVTGHGQALYGDEARKDLHKLARNFWQRGIPATGRYVKEAVTFDSDGAPSHIPSGKGIMLKRVALAAGLLAIGLLAMRYKRQSTGLRAKAAGKIGKHFLGSSYAAIGATAPASAALPALPMIPAI